MGHKPNTRITGVSYNEDIALRMNRDTAKIMRSEWYQNLFPATRIDPKFDTKDHFMTTKSGERVATSVNGTLTGAGGEFIIIDDSLKAGDAGSQHQIEKVNQWYGETLISRLDNKADSVIILIMQRLAPNDLTGFLLNNDPENEWHHINIPAIAEHDEEWICKSGIYRRKTGEALHPERESLLHIESVRRSMGTYVFAAQYQQNPIAIEGSLIKKEWVRNHRYNELPANPDFIVQGWDTASKAGEFSNHSACVTCFVKDKVFYLAHVFRDKLLYPDLKRKVIEHYNEYRSKYSCPVILAIEDKSSGISLIDELKAHNITVESFLPQGDKQSRLYNESVKFENRTFKLPKEGLAHWLNVYEDELFRFPGSNSSDQVDATVVALSCAAMNLSPTPPLKTFAKLISTVPYRSNNLGRDMRDNFCYSNGKLISYSRSQLYRRK